MKWKLLKGSNLSSARLDPTESWKWFYFFCRLFIYFFTYFFKFFLYLVTWDFESSNTKDFARASPPNSHICRYCPIKKYFVFNLLRVLASSYSRGGDVTVSVKIINQPSLPSPFLLFLCLFLSYGPFNYISFQVSPENSPFSHSVLPVLSLPNWSFQLNVSLWKSSSALI